MKLAGLTDSSVALDARVKELEVWHGDDSNELSRAQNSTFGEVTTQYRVVIDMSTDAVC